MECVIITGTSKGLGEAIVRRLIADKAILYCISRNQNHELIQLAKKQNTNLKYYQQDLADLDKISDLMKSIFKDIGNHSPASIALINNAAVLNPVMPIDRAPLEDIIRHYNINLIAPALLTSRFIELAKGLSGTKKVINITSGAAQKPYFGWSCYCASKAGLEMFSKCTAIEQNAESNPVKIISFNPGVMDTGMQQQIRSTSKPDFMDLERFITLKNEGKLAAPDFVASKVIEIMRKRNLINGEIIHIKDMP